MGAVVVLRKVALEKEIAALAREIREFGPAHGLAQKRRLFRMWGKKRRLERELIQFSLWDGRV